MTDLMEIFVDSDRYDYEKFPNVSERKNQFRNTAEGVRAMSDSLQALIDKKEQETKLIDIKNVMTNLKLSLEQAMDALGIPQGQRSIYAGMINMK